VILEPEKPFSALKTVEEKIAKAKQYVKIMDPWVSMHSLDPLIKAQEHVIIQFVCSHTGGKRKERQIKRRVNILKKERDRFHLKKAHKEKMHDRWIITDRGIWSLSQSIKDLGKKPTIGLVSSHSDQIKVKVEAFFAQLWETGIEI
jgi:hypothetical protein